MKKLNMIIGLLFTVLVSLIASAFVTVNYYSPDDGAYWIVGGTVNDNRSFYANVTGNATYGPTNATLWTNVSGTWAATTLNTTAGALGSTVNYHFHPSEALTISNGVNFLWNVYGCMNLSTSLVCDWAGSNRTMYVEDSPTVNLIRPTDGAVLNNNTVEITYNVTGDGDDYNCYLYSNESSSTMSTLEGTNNNVPNSTNKGTQMVLVEGTYVYNIKCEEEGNSNIYSYATSNYTIYVASSAPSISINSPADNIYRNTANIVANITVTGQHLDVCSLYINGTLNVTNTSAITSGTAFTMTAASLADQHYAWNVSCKTTSSLKTYTDERTIMIDTSYPAFSGLMNGSFSDNCTAFRLIVNASEDVNVSVKYGFTSYDRTYANYNTSFGSIEGVPVNFGTKYDTAIYANITICDRAGNCNLSDYPEKTLTSPVPICSGWSIWSVPDNNRNFSQIYSDANLDYLYYWNATAQGWIYYSSASTTTAQVGLEIGDAIHTYSSDSTTWFRNNSGTLAYKVNVSEGHNYLPLYDSYKFGNLSEVQFKNISSGNIINNNQFNITYFSSYNNTAQSWVSHIAGWSLMNETLLGRWTTVTGMDTIWIYSDYNISVNITSSDGYVYGNWSRMR